MRTHLVLQFILCTNLFIGGPTLTYAQNSLKDSARRDSLCTRLLSVVLGKSGVNPKLSIKNLSALQELKDQRFFWNELAESSITLSELDYFVSAATQPLIYSGKTSDSIQSKLKKTAKNPDSTQSALKAIARSPSLITAFLESTSEKIDPITKAILEQFESRLRVATETMNAISVIKSGKPIADSQDYVDLLDEKIRAGILELNAAAPSPLISESVIHALSSPAFISFLKNKKPEVSQLKLAQFEVENNFYDQLDLEASFAFNYQKSVTFLKAALTQTPVGISYRIREEQATIRFGNQNFLGSYHGYRSTFRDAYEQQARSRGGLWDIEFKVPSFVKRRLAITLDRTHQELDRIYGLDESCRGTSHVCGSYAPVVLMQNGISILTPGILTPTPTMLSLTIQRALRINQVTSVKLRGFGLKNIMKDMPIFLAKDGVLFVFGLVISAPISLRYWAANLYDRITEKHYKVVLHENENGDLEPDSVQPED